MATVLIANADAAFRASTARFLRSLGCEVETFADPPSLLERGPEAPEDQPTCVIIDLRSRGMTGLELQAELARRGRGHPVVFTAGRGDDVTESVEAMKRGAIDVLVAPVDEERVLDAVHRALESDVKERQARLAQRTAADRLGRLTAREREVLGGLTRGLLNKQIAAELGIAESTVKVHRSRMMEKLRVDSVVALMRLFDLASG